MISNIYQPYVIGYGSSYCDDQPRTWYVASDSWTVERGLVITSSSFPVFRSLVGRVRCHQCQALTTGLMSNILGPLPPIRSSNALGNRAVAGCKMAASHSMNHTCASDFLLSIYLYIQTHCLQPWLCRIAMVIILYSPPSSTTLSSLL